MNRSLVVLIVLVSALAGALYLSWPASIFRHFKERVDEQTQGINAEAARRVAAVERRLPQFFADRTRVMSEPLFAPPRADQLDAARLMWSLAPWRPSSRSSPMYERAMARFKEAFPDYREPQPFPRSLKEELDDWNGDSAAHARRLQGTSRLAMNFLRDYEVWNVDDESPRAYFETNDPFELGLSQPEPDFAELVYWGRWLLLNGLRVGRAPVALTTVKRLARLLLTTQNIVADHYALRLLDDAERFARQNGLTPPIDPETLRAAVRYYEALRGVLIPQLGDEQLHRVYDSNAPGVCAVFADSMPFLQTIRFGLERRSVRFYQWLDGVAASDVCRWALANVRRAWRPFGERALLEHWDQIQSPADEGWDEKLYFSVGVRVPALQENFGESMVLHAVDHFEAAYP